MKDDDDVKEKVMEEDVVEEGGETEILVELVRMNEIEKLTEAFGWALEKYIRAGLKRL